MVKAPKASAMLATPAAAENSPAAAPQSENQDEPIVQPRKKIRLPAAGNAACEISTHLAERAAAKMALAAQAPANPTTALLATPPVAPSPAAASAAPTPDVCRFWLRKGTCTKGLTCKLLHPGAPTTPSQHTSSSVPAPRLPASTSVSAVKPVAAPAPTPAPAPHAIAAPIPAPQPAGPTDPIPQPAASTAPAGATALAGLLQCCSEALAYVDILLHRTQAHPRFPEFYDEVLTHPLGPGWVQSENVG